MGGDLPGNFSIRINYVIRICTHNQAQVRLLVGHCRVGEFPDVRIGLRKEAERLREACQ